MDSNNKLLYALAEELKLPFIQIARTAELGRTMGEMHHFGDIETTADAALRILDSFVLSSQAIVDQTTLPLESISLSSTMYDTADRLYKLTKLYNADIDIQIKGRFGLVMASPVGLKAALTSLAYSFINSGEQGKKSRIILFAQKTGKTVTTGVMSPSTKIDRQSLNKARKIYGSLGQNQSTVAHGQGAGLYVADSLFSAMNSELRFNSSSNMRGLSARLLPSEQLALL